jgi:hypothetical protein
LASFNRGNILLTKCLCNEYDSEKFGRIYDSRPIEVWERLIEIGSPILGWYISRKFDNATSIFRTTDENEKIINERAADLKDSIVQVCNLIFRLILK